MRPSVLFPLFTTLTALRGVGPRMIAYYKRLCGENVADLLWHLPSGLIDRSYTPKLSEAEPDRIATLTVTIEEHEPPRKPSLPYRIIACDKTEQITLTFFKVHNDYLTKQYPIGEKVIVSGKIEKYRHKLSTLEYAGWAWRSSQECQRLCLCRKAEAAAAHQNDAVRQLQPMQDWQNPHLLETKHGFPPPKV